MTSPVHPSRSPAWSLDHNPPVSSAHHVTLTGKSALRNLPEVLERLGLGASSPLHITHMCILQLGLTRKQSVGLFARLGPILARSSTLQTLDVDSITSDRHSGSDALCVLLAELGASGSLVKLILREKSHPLSSALIRQLAALVQGNCSLLELDISECAVSHPTTEAILQALRTNFTLSRLLLPPEGRNEDVLVQITSILSQNRILWNNASNTAVSLVKRQLVQVPPFILEAQHLTILRLDHNNLSEIPMEIGLLESLAELSLSHNALRALSPALSNLPALQSLNASHNQLRQLPHFLGWMHNLAFLEVKDNLPGLLPPDAPSLPELLPEYLKQHTFNRAHLFQMRVFLVGEKGAGKTLLLHHLAAPPASRARIPKLAHMKNSTVLFSKTDLLGQSPSSEMLAGPPQMQSEPTWMNQASWDFCPSLNQSEELFQNNTRLLTPSKRNRASTQISAPVVSPSTPVIHFTGLDFPGDQHASHSLFFYISPRSLYLVVFDLTKEDELHRIEYWLSLISHLAPREPIVLVGTHADHRKCTRQFINDLFISLQDRLAERFNHISHFLAVSNYSRKGIYALQEKLYQISHSRILRESPSPLSFFALREKISWARFNNRRENKNAIMSLDSFRELSSSVNLTSHQISRALAFLRGVGDIIYVDENKLKNVIILDPGRLFQAFAILLADRSLNDTGLVSETELNEAWTGAGLKSSTDTMIDLLEKFELGYRLPKRLEKNISSVMLRRLATQISQSEASQSAVLASFSAKISMPRSLKKVLVPALLPLEVPDDLHSLWPEVVSTKGQSEYSRYLYFEFLPLGLFHLLMVRLLHSEWRLRLSWRAGMLLSKKAVLFLLKMHDDRISLAMRGKDSHCHLELISFLSSIETLFGDWLGIRLLQCKIPCPHCISSSIQPPYLFDLRSVEHSAAQGATVVSCRSDAPVRISDIAPDVATALINREHITWSELEILDEVAASTSSIVYKALYKRKVVAVKKLPTQSSSAGGAPSSPLDQQYEPSSPRDGDEAYRLLQFQEFRREAWTLCGLEHPNVVNLIGLCPEPPCLVMEWADVGSLYSFLHFSPPLSWETKLKIAHDIAMAMEYLHSFVPPIIHRDLKSPNCLISTSDVRLASNTSPTPYPDDDTPAPAPATSTCTSTSISTTITTATPAAALRDDVDDDYDESYSSPDESDLGSESTSSHAEINRILSQLTLTAPKGKPHHTGSGVRSRPVPEPSPATVAAAAAANAVKKQYITKVADFGLSRQLLFTSTINTKVVDNPTWLAPEVIDGKAYSTKVDVYSYGVILWEILTQQQLWADVEFQYEILDKVKAGKRPEIPPACPLRLSRLLSECWSQTPSSRPDFSHILSELRLLAGDLGVPEIGVESMGDTRKPSSSFFPPSTHARGMSSTPSEGLSASSGDSFLHPFVRPSSPSSPTPEDDDEVKSRLWNEVERLRNDFACQNASRQQAERALAFQVIETNRLHKQLTRSVARIQELEAKVKSMQNLLLPGTEKRRNYLRPRETKHSSDSDDAKRFSRLRSQTGSLPSSPAGHGARHLAASPHSVPILPIDELPNFQNSPSSDAPSIVRHRVVIHKGESLEAALRSSFTDLRRNHPDLITDADIDQVALSASSSLGSSPSSTITGPSQSTNSGNVPELMNRIFYGRQAMLELMLEFCNEE